VTNFEQDRNSTVAASGGDEYDVSYEYEKATSGRNTIRRTKIILPDGQDYRYVYTGGNDQHDRDLSRVGQIREGTSTVLVNYDYLGQNRVIGTTLEEPDIFQKRYSGSTYPDLDRWNRVTDDRWTKDLTTDVDFHDLDITYDYSSNITQVVDHVQVGFDRIWGIDDIDRVTRQDEGTESSGSITDRTRDQQWTLTHTRNWDVEQLDLNGDTDFVDTDEHDDDRTHNKVNEITARDTDDDGTDDFTLTWDVAGNLSDDDEDYEYVYDAWNRLRKIQDTSDQSLIAEYRYNGLAYRIAEHADTDDDGDVDASDEWHYFANDTSWRMVAMLVDSDTDPTKQYVHHDAGADGLGGSSYVDLVVLRDRDTTANGTLNERLYYGQNWRADVSTLFTGAGRPKEHVRYFAYGIPFGMPGGDTDSSGGTDQTDIDAIQDLIDTSSYDINGDLDYDGDVDAADKSTAESAFVGIEMGFRVLSDESVANVRAAAGSELHSPVLVGDGSVYRHVVLGQWVGRQGARGALRLSEAVAPRPIEATTGGGGITSSASGGEPGVEGGVGAASPSAGTACEQLCCKVQKFLGGVLWGVGPS